jgi:hypothetical protein
MSIKHMPNFSTQQRCDHNKKTKNLVEQPKNY